MKTRRVALLLAVLVALTPSAAAATDTAAPAPAGSVAVTYYHGKIRCQACLLTEELTRATLDTHFKDELAAGTVAFRVVNVQEPGNWHFMEDYKLDSWSLVLTLEKGGKEVRHKVLTGTAQYLRDRERFVSYLWGEVEAFVKEL